MWITSSHHHSSTSTPPHHLLWHTPLWLCMQKKNTWLFIALSYILQAAKDILYWKGNTSSLQTVSIRQYGLCTDIESSAGCYVTVPDRPNLLLWFDSIDGKHDVINRVQFSSWLENHPDTPTCPAPLLYKWSSGHLWSLCCLLSITGCFHIHRHREMKLFGLTAALISDSLV